MVERGTAITPFGAVGRIGGNAFLIESGDDVALIDYGKDFQEYRRFFEFPFILPTHSIRRELIETQVLPRLRDSRNSVLQVNVDYDNGLLSEPQDECRLRHVYFSHPHLDHAGFASLLRSDIEVHMGNLSAAIFSAVMESRRDRSLESKLYWKKGEMNERTPRLNLKTFKGGDMLGQDAMRLTPFPVDHSVPGAYGFLVETHQGVVAYTGDFRMHGPMANLTRAFERVLSSESPELLICEGTNAGGGKHDSEEQLRKNAELTIQRSINGGNRLVTVEVRSSDIDRISAFYDISLDLGMNVVMTLRLAHMLRRIQKSGLSSRLKQRLPRIGRNVKVLKPHKGRLDWWEKELLEKSWEVVDDSEVTKPVSKILILDSGRMNVFETALPRGSLYIISTSEHVNEEEEASEERFLNTLALQGIIPYRFHASGHASPLDLFEFVDEVNPRKLMPVHTEYPEMFREIFKDRFEVIIPAKGVRTPI